MPGTRRADSSQSFALNGPVVSINLSSEVQSPDISLDAFRGQLRHICLIIQFSVFADNNKNNLKFHSTIPSQLQRLFLLYGWSQMAGCFV